MNTLGIALVWCIVQVTLMSLLAAGLYLLLRRLRPAAAAPIVLASLVMVVILSLLTLSPWPRWTFHKLFQSADESSIASGASIDDSGDAKTFLPGADRLKSTPVNASAEMKNPSSSAKSLQAQPSPPAPDPKGEGSTGFDAKHIVQSFVEEISRPQAAGPASGWHWPEMVAILLMAAMACGFLWLVLGVAAVRRQSLRSRPVHDGPLLELVDVLRAELSCRRPVEIRQSDELVTAATVGWRRPVLLLPSDWTKWTAEQCRAVLAHEIAHARSHDFLALLCGQLGLMLHFYHPVVHWLMNRLRLEQELAADAAAASISGGQRQYLTTIAELALSQQDRPLLWPARTFLPTRNTFLRRIAMLRDSKLHFDRLSPTARLLTVGVIVLSGFLVAGLRGPAGPQPALAEETSNAVSETKVQAKTSEPENILANPGMENGEEYAEDWLQGNAIEGVKYSWDKNAAFEGKASLCIEKSVNRYFPIAGWAQTVDRKGELPFLEVSAQVKTKKMFKATLDVVFLDKNDQPLSHEWAAYIGGKATGDPPANHDWKKYSGTVKIPAGTAKMSIELQDYGPGKVWFDDVRARYVESKTQTPASIAKEAAEGDHIVEGVGWGKVRVGMTRHDLIEVLGNPDNDPDAEWLQWNQKHIECSLHPGATVVTEVRFNPGFQGALANGVKLGSPESDMQKFYGDKPNQIFKRDNGAQNNEYLDKGIMLWTYQGKITQIIIVKSSHAETAKTAEESPAKAVVSSKPTGNVKMLSYVGESSEDKFSCADSGFAVLFERPADMKSINAVKLFGTRYGYPNPPKENFHIYLLDEKQKVLEQIAVPYGKVQRGEMKWYTFEFPAVQVPEKFFVAMWFDAKSTKGVFVGKDNTIEQTHSWDGLPDTGFEKVDDRYDWMIRAVVSDDNGKKPSHPKVKTYGAEAAADTETTEDLPTRTWKDSTGAFSLEAEFAGLADGKVSLKKADGKTIAIPLDRLSQEDQDYVAQQAAAKKKPVATGADKARELAQDDGKKAGQKSIAGGGHAVRFEVDSDSHYVTSVSLHGARYGYPQAPSEDFKVWICDEQFKPIGTFHFPYGSFARGAPAWKSFKVKPTKVPSKFIVCFGFNPQATKGVFVSYDAEGSGNSLVGVPGSGEPTTFDNGDWLIRCKVENRSEKVDR